MEPVTKCTPVIKVHKQIARYAGPIVAVISPSEKTFGIKRHFRRVTEKMYPNPHVVSDASVGTE
jgi:hypothetical protein